MNGFDCVINQSHGAFFQCIFSLLFNNMGSQAEITEFELNLCHKEMTRLIS